MALLQWAKPALSLNRLWCPSYLCQPMLHAAKAVDLLLTPYADSPLSPQAETSRLELRSGDMVLAVGYFGLRGPALRLPPRRSASIYVLEDHSHDPWSDWAASSKADFCFASLRKTLPIPDGAVLWSPRGWVGPSARPFLDSRAAGVLQRLSGMLLKSEYLAGAAIEKDAYRACLVAGEQAFASDEPSGISPYTLAFLRGFDTQDWRHQRADNYAEFSAALRDIDPSVFEILPVLETGGVPFSLILRFKTVRLREVVRRALVAASIYPAVLWPMDDLAVMGIPQEHLQLSRELLSLPCDGRYGSTDLQRVVAVIHDVIQAESGRSRVPDKPAAPAAPDTLTGSEIEPSNKGLSS